jgi:hypothetical protein
MGILSDPSLYARILLRALFSQHLHGFLDSGLSRFRPFRFTNPFQIFTAMRRSTIGEEISQTGVVQRPGKVFGKVTHVYGNLIHGDYLTRGSSESFQVFYDCKGYLTKRSVIH